MAIVNHMDQFRQLARDLGVQNFKVILDSSMFSDQAIINVEAVSSTFVNHTIHPLCNTNVHPVHAPFTTVPCCTSIHCHIRNGLFFNDDDNDTNIRQSVLLIDSRYDPLGAIDVAYGSFYESNYKTSGIHTTSSTATVIAGHAFVPLESVPTESELLFAQGEFAGRRQHSVGDTLFVKTPVPAFLTNTTIVESKNNNLVIWAVPTCLAHPYLVESSMEVDLCHLKVDHPGEFTRCTSVPENNYYEVIAGFNLKGVRVGIATSTHKWGAAKVGQHTIRNLIEGLVDPTIIPFDPPLQSTSSTTTAVARHGDMLVPIVMMTDNCSGPNCVPVNEMEVHSCQDFMLVENDDYVAVPVGLQIVLSVGVILFMMCYFLRFRWIPLEDSFRRDLANHGAKAKKARKRATLEQPKMGITMENLSVVTQKNQPILVDVSLNLVPGTVNGLLGRSGSGKSTLLGAISGQMRPGSVIATESVVKVNVESTTYLRQHDNVQLENLTPASYLQSCTALYGSSPYVLEEVSTFIKPFFPRRTLSPDGEKDGDEKAEEPHHHEDDSTEPFDTTAIKSCSGGQRRVLAVGAALLMGRTILLLDEPLSGLDSVASGRLMHLLKSIASKHQLTILVTVHQPSDEIINHMDNLVIFKDGRKIFDEQVTTVNGAIAMSEGKDGRRRISDIIHQIVKTGRVEESIQSELDDCRCHDTTGVSSNHTPQFGRSHTLGSTEEELSAPSLQSGPNEPSKPEGRESGANPIPSLEENTRGVSLVSTNRDSTNGFGKATSSNALSQVLALSYRLRLEYGTNWTDLYLLPICYVVTAQVLNMRERNPVQIAVAVMFFIYLPVLIYQHHNPLALQMWTAHRTELDDRRISCASYYLATFTFTMSIPLLSILISLPLGFLSMGWNFEPLPIVYLFAAVYLLTMIEVASCLMLIFWGNHIYWKIFLLVLFFNVVFAGILASPDSASPWVLWLFYIDCTHFALAGAVLTLYEELTTLAEETCLSFFSCLYSDGSFAAGPSGFGYITNPHKSMAVMAGCLVGLGVIEYLLLRSRRAHCARPGSVLQRRNIGATIEK